MLYEVITTATTRADEDPVTRLEDLLAEEMEAGRVTEAVIASSEAQRHKLWTMRESSAEVTFNVPVLVDTDIALPLDRLETFLERMTPRLAALDPEAEELVIAHLGDGNIHYTAYPTRDDSYNFV